MKTKEFLLWKTSMLQAATPVTTLPTVWVVGSHFNKNLSEPLIERYC